MYLQEKRLLLWPLLSEQLMKQREGILFEEIHRDSCVILSRRQRCNCLSWHNGIRESSFPSKGIRKRESIVVIVVVVASNSLSVLREPIVLLLLNKKRKKQEPRNRYFTLFDVQLHSMKRDMYCAILYDIITFL
jgi:hypothetical protein